MAQYECSNQGLALAEGMQGAAHVRRFAKELNCTVGFMLTVLAVDAACPARVQFTYK